MESLDCSNSYYNFDKTSCLNTIPEGYFCNDTTKKTIDKCNIKCHNCSLESNKNNLCISCNTYRKFYPILNDSLNNNSFINCYNETLENYTLDNNIYKPCYYSCINCSGYGNEKDNKCISCKYGYKFINFENDTNCYENCEYYYYFDSDHKYHCTRAEICPEI